MVDVPVGGRHSHASNYSRTIAATGSMGGFSAQNIGTKSKQIVEGQEPPKIRSFITHLRKGASSNASTIHQAI